jgi:hypothetical protein
VDPNEILMFSSVTGRWAVILSLQTDRMDRVGVNTTVTSYGGLSRIDLNQNNMFLVGVFLDASEPSGAGPTVLKYITTGRDVNQLEHLRCQLLTGARSSVFHW